VFRRRNGPRMPGLRSPIHSVDLNRRTGGDVVSENERVALYERIGSKLRIALDSLGRARDQLGGGATRTGWDYVHTQVKKSQDAINELLEAWETLSSAKKPK